MGGFVPLGFAGADGTTVDASAVVAATGLTGAAGRSGRGWAVLVVAATAAPELMDTVGWPTTATVCLGSARLHSVHTHDAEAFIANCGERDSA